MIISSRTPEGWPGRCSVCGHPLRIEPSVPSRDATSPHCGSLVWLSQPAKRAGTRFGARLLAVLALAAVVWVTLLAAIRTRLGGPEIVTLSALAMLLFAPKLPRFCRWLVRR